MKLSLLILFAFVVGWVVGDVAQATYQQKLSWAILLALIVAYINNGHKLIWQWFKSALTKT